MEFRIEPLSFMEYTCLKAFLSRRSTTVKEIAHLYSLVKQLVTFREYASLVEFLIFIEFTYTEDLVCKKGCSILLSQPLCKCYENKKHIREEYILLIGYHQYASKYTNDAYLIYL